MAIRDPSAIVARYLDALGRQDWEALAACLAEDVERIGPYNDVYRGRAPYVAFLAETLRGLEGYALEVSRLIVGGNTVVAELSETANTPEGPRRTEEAVIFDLSRDERIRRIGVFLRRSLPA